MAYKCLKCNRIFNEPEEDMEYRGFVGGAHQNGWQIAREGRQ